MEIMFFPAALRRPAQVIEQPLPRAPIEVGMMPHWLFIHGVQPITPENTPLERPPVKHPRPVAGPTSTALDKPAATQQATGMIHGLHYVSASSLHMPV